MTSAKGHLSVDLGDRSRDGSLLGGGGSSAVGSLVGGLSVASSSERGGHHHQRGNGFDGRDGGGASHGRKWEEPSTPLECIDLGDPIHRWEKSTKLYLEFNYCSFNLEFLATTANPSGSLKKVWHGQEEPLDPQRSAQGIVRVPNKILPISVLTFQDRVW